MTNGYASKKWIYLVSFERDWDYRGRKFTDRGTISIPVLADGRTAQGSKKGPAA